ncbi:MAG: DUF1501 domain-containing protein [Planctomycetota bacterium]
MHEGDGHTLKLTRRRMLFRSAGGFGGLALAGLLGCTRSPSGKTNTSVTASPGKCQRVIFLYMDGGPSQMDTFDPKPRLAREHGKPIGIETPATQFNIGKTICKSPFAFSQHGECGAWVSEIFPHLAQRVDDLCFIRSMVADHSEHSAANYFMNTGIGVQGRPSIGSWVTYGMGKEVDDLPGYVVLDGGRSLFGGMTCLGNGFLPSEFQPTLFRPGPHPVEDITPREPVADLQKAKFDLLGQLHRDALEVAGKSRELDAVIANYELAFRMQIAVPELVDLSRESRATKTLYGMDQKETERFGTQCLLARKLLERGVRFVQLLAPKLDGLDQWDQHEDLEKGHRANALAVDKPIAGLLKDLKDRGLLDSTLVIWGGEFGRTPMAQGAPNGNHGRDHNPFGFTMWLAGGGIKAGATFGVTDEYGYFAIENKVHVHDLHATVLHLLGIDHTALVYSYGGREYRLTDVYGEVVTPLLG